MHNALVQFLPGEPLAQRLDHVVHEVDHQLPLLGDPLVVFREALDLASGARLRHQHYENADQQADDEKKHHGAVTMAAALPASTS